MVVWEVARSLSRKHKVVAISSFLPACHKERTDPFQRIFLPTSRVAPRVGQLLFSVMLAGVARRIRHDLWIESMPGVRATSLVPCITSKPGLALIQMRAVVPKTRRHISSFDYYEQDRTVCYSEIIVLNDTDRDMITYGRRNITCSVIPPGVWVPNDPPGPGDSTHILVLNDFHVYQNGLDFLLDAIAAAKPQLPVLIAGSGRPADFDHLRLEWTRNEAAIRLPASDLNSLAATIYLLAADDVQRAARRQPARETAERYSWDEIGELYLHTVDDCLNNRA